MSYKNSKKTFADCLKQALTLEIPDYHLPSSPPSTPKSPSASSSKSSSYYSGRLFDFKFEDVENDTHSEIFKRVFNDSQDPLKSIQNSEYRFLITPPSNTDIITDCVWVPTSKHVAQILGKKGCKIRALRETTNTIIRSPLPKEEPVFVIKGKKDGVSAAVKAIKSGSEFYTALDAKKDEYFSSDAATYKGESVVVKLTIPEPYVGLVVGIKGCTIKEIEKATNTYIKSPNFDSQSIFTITGAPRYCEKAMNFISRYLDLRGVGPGIVIESFSDLECFPGWTPWHYSFVWVHTNPAN